MKAIGLKEGWRWFDPNGTGDVDAQALYCIAQEFGIDCTLDECIMLRSRLDVDGFKPPHFSFENKESADLKMDNSGNKKHVVSMRLTPNTCCLPFTRVET